MTLWSLPLGPWPVSSPSATGAYLASTRGRGCPALAPLGGRTVRADNGSARFRRRERSAVIRWTLVCPRDTTSPAVVTNRNHT